MLVLSRKVGEEIVVPHFELVFTILEVRGGKVRVGITAPLDVQVHRRENWERIEGGPASMDNASLPLKETLPKRKAVENGASRPL